MNSLPVPEQWVIVRMTEAECAEMIEQHIDFVDKDGRSVHLQPNFVRHYVKRDDGALPTIVSITTLPIVLADGQVLGREDGFERVRGIDFRIQPEIAACVPQPGTVTDDQIERAMRFLTDDWFVDVATDYAGKCTIIAAALTIIERSLLDQRPAFFVTSGRRGGGKTTTLMMLIKAVTGISPAAAAWSTNEEERRKALLSYFMYGVPYILWDNIARGTQISCPHIEKSCTAAYYADRKLGVSEMVATAASTIHLFTGNNIVPRGDLASRSLVIRLEVDRHDPENREFNHPDPIGWTDSKRVEILRAFTPSCSATRRSKSRAAQKCKHASKCGGAWSDQQSSTPPTWRSIERSRAPMKPTVHQGHVRSISASCFYSERTRTRTRHRSPTPWPYSRSGQSKSASKPPTSPNSSMI
jgi:hypothetical protein